MPRKWFKIMEFLEYDAQIRNILPDYDSYHNEKINQIRFIPIGSVRLAGHGLWHSGLIKLALNQFSKPGFF